MRYDHECRSIGNVFRTQADAKQELEARKVIAELRRQPGRVGFVVGRTNWCFEIDFKNNKCTIGEFKHMNFGFASTYFQSQADATRAAQTVGHDRIIAAAKWLNRGED